MRPKRAGPQPRAPQKRQKPDRQATPQPTNTPDILQRAITNPDTLTPETIQRLQASHGNQFVSKLLSQRKQTSPALSGVRPTRQQQTESAVIQRLSMSEKPIDTGTLKSFKNISGSGTGGKTGLFENEGGEKLVAKVVSSRFTPEEAVAASQIMKQSGVWTPDIRIATGDDREDLYYGLQTLSSNNPQYEPFCEVFLDKMISKGWDVLLMEYVQGGKTMGEMEKSGSFVDALNDPTFQQELGMVLATDTFYGEGDRIHLKTPDIGLGSQWDLQYNPGNLMVIKGRDGYHAVPIDNDFTPSLNQTGKPFAKSDKDSSLTVASSIDDFMKEAEAIYDAFVKLEEKPKGMFVLFGPLQHWKKKKKQWAANRASFVDTVVRSGRETLDRLMQRGQGWRQQLEDAGVKADEIKNFRVRKRFMTLLRAGVEKNKAIKLARNQSEYRRWRLINELGFTNKQANTVIEMGAKAYKRSVEETIKQGKPVIAHAFDLRG